MADVADTGGAVLEEVPVPAIIELQPISLPPRVEQAPVTEVVSYNPEPIVTTAPAVSSPAGTGFEPVNPQQPGNVQPEVQGPPAAVIIGPPAAPPQPARVPIIPPAGVTPIVPVIQPVVPAPKPEIQALIPEAQAQIPSPPATANLDELRSIITQVNDHLNTIQNTVNSLIGQFNALQQGQVPSWALQLKGKDGKDGIDGVDGKNGVDAEPFTLTPEYTDMQLQISRLQERTIAAENKANSAMTLAINANSSIGQLRGIIEGISANPNLVPVSPTSAEIAAAVADYIRINGLGKGDQGDPGNNATPAQIREAVQVYLQLNPPVQQVIKIIERVETQTGGGVSLSYDGIIGVLNNNKPPFVNWLVQTVESA